MVFLKLLYLTMARNLFLTILVCFVKKWHITHITSSPGHQQERGKAEAAVKAAKHLLKTTARNHKNQYLVLLELRHVDKM